MDLKSIDVVAAAEKGFEFNFIYPDSTESDLKIEVLGAASKTYKQHMAKIDAYKAQCYKRGKEPDQEILEEKHIQMLAACTVGWEGLEEDGKPVAFSKVEAERVYAQYPLLATQVIEAIHNIVGQLDSK